MIYSTIIARYNDSKVLCEYFNESINYDSKLREQVKSFLRKQTYKNIDYEVVKIKDNYYLHHLSFNEIIIICLYDASYNKKLAKAYMHEANENFKTYILNLHGNQSEYGLIIDSVDKPYAFLSFDKTIKKIL